MLTDYRQVQTAMLCNKNVMSKRKKNTQKLLHRTSVYGVISLYDKCEISSRAADCENKEVDAYEKS